MSADESHDRRESLEQYKPLNLHTYGRNLHADDDDKELPDLAPSELPPKGIEGLLRGIGHAVLIIIAIAIIAWICWPTVHACFKVLL